LNRTKEGYRGGQYMDNPEGDEQRANLGTGGQGV